MKIMKQLLDSEMKLIKGKKINKAFLFCLFFFFIGCKSSIENKILGNWEIDHISYSDGFYIRVPDEEKYQINLTNKNSKNFFRIDEVNGTWTLKDSLLYFENTPISKTFIDSIFVVNDSFGNSSIIFQNGAQKIATFINGNLSPEKVISKMKIISVNLEELNLLIDGDTHTYVKLN